MDLEVDYVLFEISCQHFVMALCKGYDLDSLSPVCPHHMHHNCMPGAYLTNSNDTMANSSVFAASVVSSILIKNMRS